MTNPLTETTEITVIKIRDQVGDSTCKYLEDCCPFLILMESKFGTRETCFWEESGAFLKRRADGVGTLIPHAACPIWKYKNERTEV